MANVQQVYSARHLPVLVSNLKIGIKHVNSNNCHAILPLKIVFTSTLRSTREGNIFSTVCQSVYWGPDPMIHYTQEVRQEGREAKKDAHKICNSSVFLLQFLKKNSSKVCDKCGHKEGFGEPPCRTLIFGRGTMLSES